MTYRGRSEMRFPRGARNPALERLRASSRPARRPVREVLAALAPGRVLRFAPGNSRKRGPEMSRVIGEVPRWSAGRRAAPIKPASAPRAHSGGDVWMCGADIGWMRLSALRSPLYEPAVTLQELCCCAALQTSGAERVARTTFFHPPLEGEGRARRARGGGKVTTHARVMEGFFTPSGALRAIAGALRRRSLRKYGGPKAAYAPRSRGR